MLPVNVFQTNAVYWLTIIYIQLLNYAFLVYVLLEVHLSHLYTYMLRNEIKVRKGAELQLFYGGKVA